MTPGNWLQLAPYAASLWMADRRSDGVVAPSLLHNDCLSQIASETPEFDLGMNDWHENGENIPGSANILEPAAPLEKQRRLNSERFKDVVSLDELRDISKGAHAGSC